MAERDYFALGGGVSPTSQPSAASKWPSTPDGRYADTNVSPRGTRPSFPTHPYANSRYAASSASASTSTAATPMEQPTAQPSFESFDLSDVGLSAGAPAPRGVSDSNGSWSSRQGSTGKKQDIVPWAFDDDRSEEELDDAGPVQVSAATRRPPPQFNADPHLCARSARSETLCDMPLLLFVPRPRSQRSSPDPRRHLTNGPRRALAQCMRRAVRRAAMLACLSHPRRQALPRRSATPLASCARRATNSQKHRAALSL